MNFTPEQLARLAQTPHMELMLQRAMARQANDTTRDQQLAPYEHQAFAREYVGQHPVSGALGVGAAIPLYQLSKLLGLAPTTNGQTTPASLQQLIAGYQGIGEGLAGALTRSFRTAGTDTGT